MCTVSFCSHHRVNRHEAQVAVGDSRLVLLCSDCFSTPRFCSKRTTNCRRPVYLHFLSTVWHIGWCRDAQIIDRMSQKRIEFDEFYLGRFIDYGLPDSLVDP